MRLILAILPLLLAGSALARPNILLLAVDDWNDWVGCLGHEAARTPHVDRLAARGTLFTNAHCAAPVCNPSRAAVLSGLRPTTSGVYENGGILQLVLPEGHRTLPGWFKANGYETRGSGKIYHDQIGANFPGDWDHYYLWEETYRAFGWENGYSRFPDPQPDPRPAARITRETKRNFDFAPLAVPDEAMPDHLSTSYAVEFLDGQRDADRPFFLAVGQFRPHLPWFAPQRYFDRYPLGDIEIPPFLENDVDDLPPVARKRAVDKASKHHRVRELDEWKAAMQGYLASISFADAQIGRLLDALDASGKAEETIILLWSDHGYHLGEKGHWHKRTLWERSTRVPLIVVAPGVTRPGTSCANAVDLMAVYPTLLELAGLPPNDIVSGEGQSLLPMLRDPEKPRDTVALSTHNPGNHAVRSATHRYIRYADGSEELYDHREDPNEWHNLVGRRGTEPLIAELAARLPESEAPPAPDYYKGTALLRLEGDSYSWGRRSEIGNDPEFKNAARIKSQAWKAAAAKKPPRPSKP